MWKEINFEKTSFTCEDEQLKPISQVLEDSPKELELKTHIKSIVDIYKAKVDAKAEIVEAKNLLLRFFDRFSSKKNVKKYLQDVTGKYGLTTLTITSTTESILLNININQNCNIRECVDLLNFVFLMQNSPDFEYGLIIEKLFPLYCMLLEGFVYHSQFNFEKITLLCEELTVLINVVLKNTLSVFARKIPFWKIVSETYSVRLVMLSHSLVIHSNIGFDIKTKAGLIITHSLNLIPEKFSEKIKYKVCPALDLVKGYNENEYFNFNDQNLEVVKNTDDLVIIYASILTVYPNKKLFEVKIDDEALICLLYHKIMECAKSQTSISHIIVEISRSLSILGAQLKEVPLGLIKPIFLEGLSYVWTHIEHFVDTVRDNVKVFLEGLVEVAVHHKNNGYIDLTHALLNDVKKLDNYQSAKIIAIEVMAGKMGTIYLLEHFRNLPDDLLHAVSKPPVSEQVCKTYKIILDKAFKEHTKAGWINRWVAPAVSLMRVCPHCSPVAQDIVSSAFQLYPALLRRTFPNGYVANTQEANCLLKCLMFARQKGIELNVEANENSDLYWRGLIDKEKLCAFMTHQNDGIRLGVLAVVVTSQKSTEFFLNWEFDYLVTYLGYNITPNTPHARMQVLGYYKKVLARFNSGYHCIMRNIGGFNKKVDAQGATTFHRGSLYLYRELQKFYRDFIFKFTKLLISYLTFDSNYCRRAITLELLVMIQTFLSKNDWLSCWTVEDIKNCHSILFDSYENNKKMCVMLLKNLPFKSMGFTNVDFTFKYLQRCVKLALDIKPSKTLSAAYLFEVCAYSPHFIDIIQFGSDDSDARQKHDPILDMIVLLTDKLIAQSDVEIDYSNPKVANYGILLSIRHLLQMRDVNERNETYSGLFERITKFCLSLKDTLLPIVCSPSPEGYLPETDEVICESDESRRAQMVLVYSWRTMREMALLLAEIVRENVKLESTIRMLPDDLVKQVGELFITIFIESKHRGVFEQAYIGFCVMCDSLWVSTNPELSSLPPTWLQEVLKLCMGETSNDKLCSTRRSAGLPFLVLAFITSEPILDKTRIGGVVTKILEYCEKTEEINTECRIHCLNVLRSTFRHGRMSDIVACFVGRATIIAINGYKSDSWGVRNSSTILFVTLITRIFGFPKTNDSDDEVSIKNRLTIRIFYLRYPDLCLYLLEQLALECKKGDSLLLQPVLMMLSRLYPSPFEQYSPIIEKCFQDLTVCVSNPVYKTRELAARASVSFLTADKIFTQLDIIFEKLKVDTISDNECHGLLLQVLYISKANDLKEVPLTTYLQRSLHILKYAGSKFSHMTASLYMETVLVFLMNYKTYGDLEMVKTILKMSLNRISSSHVPVTAMNKFLQTRILLILYIVVNVFEESDLTYPTVTNLIISQLYGPNMDAKRFCLSLLIYLNQIQSDYKHALYDTEEMQIPREIVIIVDCLEKSSIKRILTHLHQNLKCFLMQEIKGRQQIKKEDLVLLFLLVNYYPCVIKYLNLSKQETLNALLNFCDCDNEELISAVLSCISTFLLELDYNVLHYGRLINALAASASPAASDYRRLTVCDFLVKNYILYCNEEPILNGDDLQMMFNIMMVLLEDDSISVRNAMSEFATLLKVKIALGCNPRQTFSGLRWPVISEKAREDLLFLATIRFKKDRGICFLFSWACRHFPDCTSNEGSEVFERGELNLYSENVSFTALCAKILRKYLWTLEDGLNYEDNSIFIEEHTLLVTTYLLDAIQKNPSPMMLYRTKVSVICALKSIMKFVEHIEINNNFVQKFKIYLNETIIGYLTKHVEHSDLLSIKWILRNIYEPILTYKP